MAVRIRMKKMGRAHRPFYRLCAMDQRTARDGKVIEELGFYDTSVPETDARAVLKGDRISYWLSVGAQPSPKCSVLIKKYGEGGTHLEKQRDALERLKAARAIPAPAPMAAKPERKKKANQAAATTPSEAGGEAAASSETAADAAADNS